MCKRCDKKYILTNDHGPFLRSLGPKKEN